MKNFKKVVFGLLAMLVMVTGVRAAVANGSQSTFSGSVNDEDGLRNCMTATVSGTCKLTKNVKITALMPVTSEVTVDLNGHTITANVSGAAIDVASAANLTMMGGKLEFTNTNITVHGKLVVSDTTMDITTGTNPAIMINTDKNVELNNVELTANKTAIQITDNTGALSIYGSTIKSDFVALEVAAGSPEITVDDSALISADNAYHAKGGTPKFNLVSGTVETTGAHGAMNVKHGEVTLKGGEVKSAGNGVDINGAVKLVVPKDSTVVVNSKGIALNLNSGVDFDINAGTYTSTDTYAMHVLGAATGKVTDGRFVTEANTNAIEYDGHKTFVGGVFVAPKDQLVHTQHEADQAAADDYTALIYGDAVYIGKAYTLTIEVDETNAAKVDVKSPQTLLAGYEYKFADEGMKEFLLAVAAEGYQVKYVLVIDDENQTEITGDGFVMPEADATLKVSFVKAEEPAADKPAVVEPGKNPENNGEPASDEQTNTNPSTFDGIASIVTMAISSVSAAGYSIKKIVRR